jgi:hypothetical protein
MIGTVIRVSDAEYLAANLESGMDRIDARIMARYQSASDEDGFDDWVDRVRILAVLRRTWAACFFWGVMYNSWMALMD